MQTSGGGGGSRVKEVVKILVGQRPPDRLHAKIQISIGLKEDPYHAFIRFESFPFLNDDLMETHSQHVLFKVFWLWVVASPLTEGSVGLFFFIHLLLHVRGCELLGVERPWQQGRIVGQADSRVSAIDVEPSR